MYQGTLPISINPEAFLLEMSGVINKWGASESFRQDGSWPDPDKGFLWHPSQRCHPSTLDHRLNSPYRLWYLDPQSQHSACSCCEGRLLNPAPCLAWLPKQTKISIGSRKHVAYCNLDACLDFYLQDLNLHPGRGCNSCLKIRNDLPLKYEEHLPLKMVVSDS